MRPFTRAPCRLDIHRQIMLIAVAPSLVITTLLVFVIFQGNLQHSRRLLDQQGQLLAAQLAAALEYGLATGALEQLPAIVEAAVQPATVILGTPVRRVIVTDRDGHVLYRRPAVEPVPPPVDHLANAIFLTPEEDGARFVAPVLLQPLTFSTAASVPRPLGEVAVELAIDVAQVHWRWRLAGDLAWVLLTVAGAVSLAHWTGRRLSGAIRRIAAAIQRIKNGDFTARVRQTERSELGTLQEGVNLLADALERGKARLDQEIAEVRAEYQRALDALRIQSQAAERANQAKSLFLAKVSHEMRTPLYSIQGSLEQLLKTAQEETETRILSTLLAAADTLYRHISDILDFTQLEKGKYALSLVPLTVWDELDAVAAALEPLLVARGLYLDVVVAPTVPAIIASDGKAFRAILTNLLGNAVKYTESGGIVVEIEAMTPTTGAFSPTHSLLRLRVTDTGCGIPSDRLETIFAPFEQVDEALNRRYPGTGLGLSIVKSYCERLGGSVAVASGACGSIFTVELPLRVPDDLTSARPLATNLPAGLRMLVIDERASFRASITAHLADLGLAVEERALSPVAWAGTRVSDSPYDLLVVQNLSETAAGTWSTTVTGLRHHADRLVALETRYDGDIDRRLQHAGLDLVLWSGATRDAWRIALARIFSTTTAEAARPPAPSHLPLTGRTVLVVEDYAINRAIMVNQLRSNGARVLEAADGDTAVDLALEPGLDLVLMDIQMPGKDGIAAIRDIRRFSTGRRLPILGFTASADKPTHQRILAAGADGVLTKPLSEIDLVRAIRRALRHPLPPAGPTHDESDPLVRHSPERSPDTGAGL